jgi:hypothetical protein
LRAWVRNPSALDASLSRPGAPAEGLLDVATVVNVSVGGVGVEVGREVRPGELLLLNLRNRSTGFCVNCLARVAHAERLTEGRWRAGCAFERPLTADELDALQAGN